MNDDQIKIKEPPILEHYPVDTHLVRCCLREGDMKNIKGREDHKEKKKKFNEKKVFNFKFKKVKKKKKK